MQSSAGVVEVQAPVRPLSIMVLWAVPRYSGVAAAAAEVETMEVTLENGVVMQMAAARHLVPMVAYQPME